MIQAPSRHSQWTLPHLSDPLLNPCLRSPLRTEIHTPEDRGLAQKALDMLSGMRAVGRTETEAVIPVNAQLTAVGELVSTSRPGAVSSGSIRSQKGHVVALQVVLCLGSTQTACLIASHESMVHPRCPS